MSSHTSRAAVEKRMLGHFTSGGGGIALFHPDEFVRKTLTTGLIKALEGFEPHFYNDADAFLSESLQQSLFCQNPLHIFLDAKSSLKKERLPQGGRVIIGAEAPSMLPKIPEGYLAIDFSKEKPWEAQERTVVWALEHCRSWGKRCERELIHELCHALSHDLARIFSEIDKLVAFVGDKSNIERRDIEQIGCRANEAREWQLAEGLVWEGRAVALPSYDTESFLRFAGLLRYHFRLGIVLLGSDQPIEEAKKKYPKMLRKIQSLYLPQAKALRLDYFMQGVSELFRMELALKTRPSSVRHLWELFINRVVRLRF